MKKQWILYLLIFVCIEARALTSTIYANTGTYGSGSVTSTGTKTSGNFAVSSIATGTPRGWATFNLTAIPWNATVTSVTIKFYTYSSSTTTSMNIISGFTNDPVTTTGTSLFSILGLATSYNNSTWTTSGWQTKTLSITSNSLVQNNLTTSISFAFRSGNSNQFNIYGSTSTYPPSLIVNYTLPAVPLNPTNIIASSSNICPGDLSTLTIVGNNYDTYWFSGICGYYIVQTIGSGLNLNVSPTTTTTYYARNYNNGVWSNNCASVTINVAPQPFITSSNNPFCEGSPPILTTTFGVNSSYQWFVDGVLIPGEVSSTHLAFIPGIYSVTESNTDFIGCQTTSFNFALSSTPHPIANITGANDSICQGTSLTLTTLIHSGSSYQWYKNGTLLPNETSNTYSTTLAGNYTVQETNLGCSTTSSAFTLTINPVPSPLISTPLSSLCQGSTRIITTSFVLNDTYQWYVNGVLLAGETSNSYSATQFGNYTVKQTDSLGCYNTSSVYPLSITALPAIPLITCLDSTICDLDTAFLSTPIVTGLTYQWYIDGTIISGSNSHLFYASLAGNYTVLVTGTSGCQSQSPPSSISVFPHPTPVINSLSTVFCVGGVMELSTPFYSNSTYKWYKNTTITTEISNVFIATLGAEYIVQETNLYGCYYNSPSINLTAISPPPIQHEYTSSFDSYIFNNITYTESGIYYDTIFYDNGCDSITILNITILSSELEEEEGLSFLSLYPNPSSDGLFNIIGKAPSLDLGFCVKNIRGQIVLKKDHMTETLDLSHYENGIYWIEFNINNKLKILKIVKM